MSIVEVALSEVGTKGNNNDVKYNTWYYRKHVSGGAYPWCAVFISWCAEQAGVSTRIVPKTASVRKMTNFFKEQDRLHRGTDYTPVVGDIAIYQSPIANHAGIVTGVTNKGYTTVEGSLNDTVMMVTHSWGEADFYAFAHPNYPEPTPRLKMFKVPLKAAPATAASGTIDYMNEDPQMKVEEIWDWFRYKGYTAEATAGIMGRLQQEHNFSPTYATFQYVERVQAECGGFGMFQWTYDNGEGYLYPDYNVGRYQFPGSRLSRYLDWCDANGRPYESCRSQLDYFWEHDADDQAWSAQGNYGFDIGSWKPEGMNNLGLEDAAYCWRKGFERGHEGDEVAYAQELYAAYKDRPAPTSTPPSTGGSVSVAHTSSRNSGNVDGATGLSVSNVGRYTYEAYTVKDGDTLESIAKEKNVTPQMILFANNLKEWKVTPGQTIYIPKAKDTLSRSDAIANTNALEQLKHTMSVTVSHPTIRVEFYGEYGKLNAVTTMRGDTHEHVDNDIISVNTTRHMGQDCPTFNISLVWRNEWYKALASCDMLIIYMQRPPEEEQPVMFGLIDDVRKSMDWSSGQPQRSVTVTGRGFNKCLVQFDVGVLQNYSGFSQQGEGFFKGMAAIQSKDSANAIKITLDHYIDKGMNYRFGNGKCLKDYMVYNYIVQSYVGEILIDYQQFGTYLGSLWNFIKTIANAPFNETYWEVINNKPNLVHRPTPFMKNDWVKLNRTLIKDDEIVSNTTGRSDLETYTVYYVSQQGDETQNNFFNPLWYPPFYDKYGLRQIQTQTIYRDKANSDNPKMFTRMLYNFNIKNNISENGTIVVKGSNRYKVGERIILESEDMEFYVESVTHSFNLYSTWTTSLGVTRGLHPEQRFLTPYGAYEDLTPTIMQALMNGGEIDWHALAEKNISRGGSGSGGRYTGGGGDGNYTGSAYDFHGKLFVWPYKDGTDYVITCGFGPREPPVPGASSWHGGIDIAADDGTEFCAIADGVVINAGPASGYGNWIQIDHGDGIISEYGHMWDEGVLVSTGQQVKAGDVIGLVGSNGYSSGPHLHLTVYADGEKVDPMMCFAVRKEGTYTNAGVNASPNEVVSAIYTFATTQLGVTPAAACALLANIEQESSFIVDNINSNSGAYGLCQWMAGRKTNLEQFCVNNGYQMASVEGQLAYLKEELNGSENSGYIVLQSIPNTRDGAYQGAYDFCRAFERCGEDEIGPRGKNAIGWWDKLVGG